MTFYDGSRNKTSAFTLMTTELEQLRAEYIYCEEQLSMAGSVSDKMQWGNRCDALEAAILDILDGDDHA